nr:hypothetical protein [uncultured Albidiferax sp.]
MDLGVDMPNWWAKYEDQKAIYFTALGAKAFLHDLALSDGAFRAEKWRRYELCVSLRIATCKEVHYPDLFETVESIRPARLDDVRSDFPADAFGRYLMSCPPRNRFLNLEKLFVLDEVWGEHADFFKGAGLLKQGAEMPLEAVLSEAPNAVMRDVLKRHGVRAAAIRKANEHLVLAAIANDVAEQGALRMKVIAPELWCRMPPEGLTWDQLQAFRWQSRAIGGAVVDLFN